MRSCSFRSGPGAHQFPSPVMRTKNGIVMRGLYLILSEVLDQVVAAEAVHEACTPGAEVSTWGMAHGAASSVADA